MKPSWMNPPKPGDYFEAADGLPLDFQGVVAATDTIYRVESVDTYENRVNFIVKDFWFHVEYHNINMLTVEEVRSRMMAAWRNSGTKQREMTAQNLQTALPRPYQIAAPKRR